MCTLLQPWRVDFHSILDVSELWKFLGADLPGVLDHLLWRARCLLVSTQALHSRRLVLYRLRAQQEMDEAFESNSHGSAEWVSLSDDVPSLPGSFIFEDSDFED